MPKQNTAGCYRVHEFAGLSGVTVRALHHYDQLGLLKPSRRSAAGYRLYGDHDLARLEQIVVLKFLGLPLKEIRDLLKRETPLVEALGHQQRVLNEKRSQLDRSIQAIGAAAKSLESKKEPDWQLIKSIIQEIEMQNETEWSKQYYSEDAKARIEERKALWSPELQAKVSQDWAGLFADIEAALGEDPAGPQGQALAARWRTLVAGFTGGDPEIQKGLNKMYADQTNWPAGPKAKYQIKPEIQSFITKAMQPL
jgi:DNA-binding transcriptional MerR regulator